ncbi:MAG: hypothetical protein AAFV29_20455, partial [Myxococcota bacterium]
VDANKAAAKIPKVSERDMIEFMHTHGDYSDASGRISTGLPSRERRTRDTYASRRFSAPDAQLGQDMVGAGYGRKTGKNRTMMSVGTPSGRVKTHDPRKGTYSIDKTERHGGRDSDSDNSSGRP